MIKKIITTYFFLISFNIYSDKDCLDNSKHTKIKNGYDYKKYLPVKCYCPCRRYPILFARGQCSRCGHYRALK